MFYEFALHEAEHAEQIWRYRAGLVTRFYKIGLLAKRGGFIMKPPLLYIIGTTLARPYLLLGYSRCLQITR